MPDVLPLRSGTSTKVSLDVLTAYLDSEEFEYTLTDGTLKAPLKMADMYVANS